MQKENQEDIFLQKVVEVLGPKLHYLIPQQLKLLDRSLGKIFDRHQGDASTITSDEIIGAYELITEHVYPFEFAAIHGQI